MSNFPSNERTPRKRKRWKDDESEEDDPILNEEMRNTLENKESNLTIRYSNFTEQKHFLQLYRRALNIFLGNVQTINDDIRKAAINIKLNFKNNQFTRTDFGKSENLCAYFFAYSTLNTALARHRVLNALNSCNDLNKLIQKSNLNVISLGGGPGTDMIGFCSALYEVITDAKKTLNLIVVDKWKRWGSFYNIIQFLLQEKLYGNVSSLLSNNNVYSSFMCIDLKNQTPTVKYKLELENADIVLLVRVLDALNFNEEKPGDILKNIVTTMNQNALLLLIDSGARDRVVCGMDKLYCSNLNNFVLSVRQDQEFFISPSCNSKAEIAVFKKTETTVKLGE